MSMSGKIYTSFQRSHSRIRCRRLATRWTPSHSSLSDLKTALELGSPVPLDQQSPTEASHWKELDSAADKPVLELYPKLLDPPFQAPPRAVTPWRLFRNLIPTKLAAMHDYSSAFVGLVSNNQLSTHAEISALWAVVYLEKLLTNQPVGVLLSSERKMDADVAA